MDHPHPKATTTATTADATQIVQEWLTSHPELGIDLRAQDPEGFRAAVTVYLLPYDRFPSTLGKLLTVALDAVDWSSVFNHVEDRE